MPTRPKFHLLLAALAAAAFGTAPLPAAAVHFADAVRGMIVLDVERDGAAWYVLPSNLTRLPLGTPEQAYRVMTDLGFAARYPLAGPADALRIMREHGLGISHENLAHIAVAGSGEGGVLFDVPFTPQAPFGNWKDLRQEEGCEEASALMAVRWAEGRTLTKGEALREIVGMADQETKDYGYHEDTSAEDTAARLFKGYLGYDNVEVRHDIGTDDVLRELRAGNLVVAPADGQKLRNPHFGPGVRRHMIVIAGYDADTDEFIAHDPGTRYGERYRYSRTVLDSALEDYASGVYAPIPPRRTAMIVVKPQEPSSP